MIGRKGASSVFRIGILLSRFAEESIWWVERAMDNRREESLEVD
jgi:hypothetical protein